ncbi:uncharacterized protein TIGR03905 [Paucidesulfovibrio gracilis DSM 16080]|uniref:ribonucleoside-diphosphate reductase n=1 Tax=Paucidesulfovibrio gracilis DSM 16080 TaxID=1121449 RepID=A0A1T4WZ77_9BACT|nr:TIGR03905 family TSCPD domain-containing protein [Paucidesulfovibrio gracilis]SKA82626.1 uncharacterized protein TIGR03905 [Paucidesulfovibrio gracilis DSM 16080]
MMRDLPMSFAAGLQPDNDGSSCEQYVPQGVCSKHISYQVRDGKVYGVHFTGGCDGNLKAVAALVEGMALEDVLERLEGITCGKRGTSCPDQFCHALRRHL